MRAIAMIPADWQGMTCPRALFSIRDNSLTRVYRDNFSRVSTVQLVRMYVCMHVRSRIVTMLLNSQGLVSACKYVIRNCAAGINSRERIAHDRKNSSKERRVRVLGQHREGKIRFRRVSKNAVAKEKPPRTFPIENHARRLFSNSSIARELWNL